MPFEKENKEFYWNKFARNDYLYFANCRLCAHFWNFIYEWPKNNCFYVCSKTNGDINGSFYDTKIKKFKNPIHINKNIWEISNELIESICKDLHYGILGKFCYILIQKDKYYFLYKIELKSFKDKNKIISQLRKYRAGKIKSKANTSFMRSVELTSYLDPEIMVTPKKKIKMFKNKKIYSNF